MNETRACLFLLKLMETVSSAICLVIHIKGYLNLDEPLPHETIYCGTYFCFLLHAFLGATSIYLNFPVSILIEAISNTIASLLFIVAAFITMVHVENDAHLKYLADKEELRHPFFLIGRLQSILSMITGFLFAIHSSLMWDMLFVTESNPNQTDAAYQPLQLHFFPYDVIRFMKKIVPEQYCCQNIEEQIDFTHEIRSNRNIDRII